MHRFRSVATHPNARDARTRNIDGRRRTQANKHCGGWGGIRTHDRVAPMPVFKTGALNRSATHPRQKPFALSDGLIRKIGKTSLILSPAFCRSSDRETAIRWQQFASRQNQFERVIGRRCSCTSVACWRMGWDSDPRATCAAAGFQDRCLKPLGHPSATFAKGGSPARELRARINHAGIRARFCRTDDRDRFLEDSRCSDNAIALRAGICLISRPSGERIDGVTYDK